MKIQNTTGRDSIRPKSLDVQIENKNTPKTARCIPQRENLRDPTDDKDHLKVLAVVRLKLEDLTPAVPCTSRESSHGQPIPCNVLVICRREAKHEGVACMRHRMIEVDQLQSMNRKNNGNSVPCGKN